MSPTMAILSLVKSFFADNGDLEFGEILFVATNGKRIEHGLGRVGMAPITGVDQAHMWRQVLGDQEGGATVAVAYHEQIGVHGLEIVDGVEDGFTLAGG